MIPDSRLSERRVGMDPDDMVMAYRTEDRVIQIIWFHENDTAAMWALSDDQAKSLLESLKERIENPDQLGI